MMKRRMIACAVAAALLTGAVPAFPDMLVHAENYTAVKDESGVYCLVYSDRVEISGYWNAQESYEIPSEVEGLPVISINERSFYDHSTLKSVTIPSSVMTIGDSAFYSCNVLESVTFSEGLETISANAFKSCPALLNITIPGSVTSIGYEAFYDCDALKTLTFAEGDGCIIGEEAFRDCDALHTVTMESGVTEIQKSAFSSCDVLENLTFSDTLKTVSYSFQSCPKLATVDLPDSLTSMQCNAFYGSAVYTNQTDVLIYVDDWVVYCNTDVAKAAIKEGTRGIAEYAFGDCTSLTSLTISEGLEIIDTYAFNNCRSLLNLQLPSTVTEIDSYAFNECRSITSLTLPESLEVIAQQAFDGMDYLKELTILSTDCSIFPSADTISAEVTINGYTSSTAQSYADTFGLTFVALDEVETTEPTDTTEPTEPDTTITLTPDINQDGRIDAVDAAWILQYAAASGAGYTGSIADFVAENNA